MAKLFDSTRRTTGLVFLGTATLMLMLGLTVLAPHLRGTVFLGYWLACICFTLSAATVALLEFSAVRRNASREQRELIESTVAEIEKKAAEERQKKRQNSPPDV